MLKNDKLRRQWLNFLTIIQANFDYVGAFYLNLDVSIWHFDIYQTICTRLFCRLNYLAYVAF